MNWKEKAEELLKSNLEVFLNQDEQSYASIEEMQDLPEYHATIKAMIEFAKLTCEEQKKICAENAEADIEIISDELHAAIDSRGCWTEGEDFEVSVIHSTILNAPTVNFEEDTE